ncbi:WD repeat-containing protein 70-like [Fukomys damarensis]|uniref:WD repeat-containing protein 70-like n=1 Tax=Fukomys damarensis TaxID=885580 RepID=UPI001455D7CA|nr:WD repeat-containing protein 70-like [Fukomys damarensis]
MAMERSVPSEVTAPDVAGPDPQLAVTMGFTGFGKKARTFDLEAMFEQTRRTAVERSRKTLEAREKEEEMNREKQLRQNEDIEPTPSGSNMVRDCSKSSSRDTSSSESEDSSDSSSDELIGPPLPLKMVGEPVNLEEDILGPLLPPLSEEEEEEEDDDDDDEGEENPVQKIPDSHEITLKHGTKTVSALGLDPSGARLVTGGYDYDVKFWDFAGMDASFKAFRSLQPCECHQIKSLQYSNTGDMILVVSGSSQAKVIDRDGFEVMECIKGDQYIVDMANTKAFSECGGLSGI